MFQNFPCVSDLLPEASKFQHHTKLCEILPHKIFVFNENILLATIYVTNRRTLNLLQSLVLLCNWLCSNFFEIRCNYSSAESIVSLNPFSDRHIVFINEWYDLRRPLKVI